MFFLLNYASKPRKVENFQGKQEEELRKSQMKKEKLERDRYGRHGFGRSEFATPNSNPDMGYVSTSTTFASSNSTPVR